MKRIAVLILFLTFITTGCSYEIAAGNSQELYGENENWKVEYKINFSTQYPQKDGKFYAHRRQQKTITVTYKNDLSDLSSVKRVEISYEDSFGGGGRLTEEYDSPPTKKQFRLSGGGSETTAELGDYIETPENLHKAIMIYSGPGDEMRSNATATVTVQTDGVTDAIQLLPVKDPSPVLVLSEQISNKLSKKPFLRFFSGRASDLSLKLDNFHARVVTDKSITGSIDVTEGDKKGQELVPTVLYYEFTLRNEGRKPIIGSLNDLQVNIIPSDNLKEVSEAIVGINLFDPDFVLGNGQSISGDIFSINNDCKIALSFDLSKVSAESTLITPSVENLEKLLDSASDASLIIIYKDEEAARFDLNKY